jgi:hypothetical protein
MNARAQPSARSISPSGKVATLKAIIFLLAALVAQGVGLADAASVTRTESGGIVISAYGERMSFKEGDAGRTVFNFVGSNCDSNKRAFLIDAINRQDIVDCVSKDENVTADDRAHRGTPPDIFADFFLGGRDDEQVYAIGVEPAVSQLVGLMILEGQRPHISIFVHTPGKGPLCNTTTEGADDALGYTRREIRLGPHGFQFTLPAARRASHAERLLCLSCFSSSADASPPEQLWFCGIDEVSLDGGTVLTFWWLTKGVLESRVEWTALDTYARSVARSIFADRPSDDFQ